MKYFLMLFVLNAAYAGSGGVDGGGAKSVVCRDSQGKIVKAELLDLFEGRIQYQLNYSESSIPWKKQGKDIIVGSGLPTETYPSEEIISWFRNFTKHLTIISDEVILKPTDDSYEVIAPRGCNIEQAANYQNDNLILVSGEIWNAFSETQKAALAIHEATYRYLRSKNEKNSKRARHLTAHIMAGKKVNPFKYTYENEVARCWGEDEEIVVITSFTNARNQERNKLYFNRLGARTLLSESYADVDSMLSSGDRFIDLLVNPEENKYFMSFLKTESLFEPGEKLVLSAGRDFQIPKVLLKGVSIVDETPFAIPLKCQYSN